ncbi:helix-turn-helix domain-containing protein [Maribellus maritimus]|uniref:helix-turn-helix domain-containing protein n=1 Tax=Maribellus maritimus TaxID=2870838 RepID=UPI001EEC9551|nr:AraC family transcriptional regulator [Maribellus maritimus]MCG6188674.1 AraC family transcriptional regulator [Maribellus maritimus]
MDLINFSCHTSDYREGEHFTSAHSFGMVISGIMELNDGEKKKQFKKGDLYSARKNHLLKFVKHPPANGEFKSISIYFDEELLRDFSIEYGCIAENKQNQPAYISFPNDKLLTAFIDSLLRYEDALKEKSDIQLIRIKQKEALLLLLHYDASLKDSLFDFSDPHKIDLEAFMNKNFHFNVHLDKFAYLTGRSMAAFKRDFQKIFNDSPRHWLQQKRLQEAHYLLSQKGKIATDIYLDLGFENLSHFSYAFKKMYGYNPSSL